MLADTGSDLQAPRVSTDGTRIVYQARLADHRIELRVTDLSTKTTSILFRTESSIPAAFSLSPGWSPDGVRIVFSCKTTGNANIYSIGTDGSGLQQLTNETASDTAPAFSADGKEIFFARDLYGMTKLFRMNADGTQQRRITTREGYELTPAISPDGTTIFFAADRQDGKSLALDIFAARIDNPDDERIVASRPMHDSMPIVSPDGGRAAFVGTGDGNQEIYVMRPDGSQMLRVTRNKAADMSPSFSPDGKLLYFGSDRDGRLAIYAIDLPDR